MPPLIPSWILSALAISAGILCFFGYRKAENMIRSSLVQMLRMGIVLLAPALITFGALYFYFLNYEVNQEARQIFVRWLLAYVFISVNIWQVILLKWGNTL